MFFERHEGGEKVVLVHPECHNDQDREDPCEFRELVRSSGAKEVAFLTMPGDNINPRYFVGIGKLEEIRQHVMATGAEVVLFNHALSPGQERNLERELKMPCG